MDNEDLEFVMWLLDRPHLPGQEDAKRAIEAHAKLCAERAKDQLEAIEYLHANQN